MHRSRARSFVSGVGTAAMAAALAACGGGNTSSPVDAPDSAPSAGTRTLEMGAALLQDKPPVEALNVYVNGFHFHNGDMRAQMEAHHYCSILSADLIQCVIFDGNVRDARLMGVEYIISAQAFATLPPPERPLWHSHVHEVKSGQLIAPGIPALAEHELMEKLVGTYGKTFHTWHTDRQHSLPLGVPGVMMGFTADGQVDEALVAARDRRFGISTMDERRDRSDIPSPTIAEGADAWQQGRVLQITDPSAAAE